MFVCAFLPSNNGISGFGSNREEFREILLFEMWNVPVTRQPDQASKNGLHDQMQVLAGQIVTLSLSSGDNFLSGLFSVSPMVRCVSQRCRVRLHPLNAGA